MNLYVLNVSAGLAFVVLLAYLLGLTYFSRLKVSLPPYGRVNWRDVTVILAGLGLLPLVLLVVPPFDVSIWIALAFFSSLAWLFMPVIKRASMVVPLAAGTVILQFVLKQVWLNDVITILGISFVAIYAVQGGITVKEAIYLGIGYSVYDLFAVALFAPLFSISFYSAPLVPVIIVQYIGVGAFVGMGGADLLLFILFALVLARTFGRRVGTAFALSGVLVIFLLSSLFLTIPASPFLLVLFLAAFGVVQASKGEEPPGPMGRTGDLAG